MDLHEILNRNVKVPISISRIMEAECTRVSVPKRDFIIKQGEKCDFLVFITDGLFRAGYVHDEDEETLCFGVPGDPFMSVSAYYKGEPAKFSFQSLAHNSEVLILPFENFNLLKKEFPIIQRWWESVLVEQIYAFENRYVNLGTSDAYNRYKTFVKLRPEIIGRIPLKYVAQYIHIQPETLSRIRGEYSREQRGED